MTDHGGLFARIWRPHVYWALVIVGIIVALLSIARVLPDWCAGVSMLPAVVHTFTLVYITRDTKL